MASEEVLLLAFGMLESPSYNRLRDLSLTTPALSMSFINGLLAGSLLAGGVSLLSI